MLLECVFIRLHIMFWKLPATAVLRSTGQARLNALGSCFGRRTITNSPINRKFSSFRVPDRTPLMVTGGPLIHIGAFPRRFP
jgi:hypothetical protein